jgi:tetratricopeptide (TPR) repeat protein
MYQLYHGISLYELERDERTRPAQGRPAEVAAAAPAPVDPSETLESARNALWRATRLDPELWRAHYYLGQVYRDLGDPGHAAEQFTQTIATHPTYRVAYIALTELYRNWDYLDQALAVALLGTQQVRSDAELWYEAGMAYDARHADDQAIAAFDKAIAGKFRNLRPQFQRGQIYLRKGDVARARRDLEEVVRSTDPQMAEIRPIAAQLLSRFTRVVSQPRPGQIHETIE